jgi:Brp/Blh family beta-carotene 15,15'-monooxygenase
VLPVRAVGVAALSALVLLAVVAPDLVAALAVPIAVVGVVLGVPHGAADHLVPFWAAGRAVSVPRLAVVLVGYVAVVGAALAAVLAFPTATVWAFLAASAVHFGRGEVVASAELAGRATPPVRHDALPALAHGAVTVGLLLTVSQDLSLPLLDAVAPGFAATPDAVLLAILVGTYAVVALALVRLAAHGRRRDCAELALLTVAFTVVPAPAVFGVYFACWHAARHTARLVLLPGPDGTVDVRHGLVRYARAAAAPTVAALALLAVVAAAGSRSVLVAALVTLIALTAPHLVVVAALDRRRAATGASSSLARRQAVRGVA